MFGSNDDKKTPAAAGEKKGLFGWLRKKPQEPVVEQPQVPAEPAPTPVIEPAASVAPAEPVVLPMAEPVLQPHIAPEPAAPAAPDLPLAASAEHKPWLTLPVAEEPVALVEDAQAEHVAPPIPAVAVHPEPVVEAPVVTPAPVVEVQAPVAPVFVAPEPVAPAPVAEPVVAAAEPEPVTEPVRPAEESKIGFFARLKQGLSKTSASIGEGMASLFLGKKAIDDELLEDLETRLLTADVGVEATSVIIQNLTQKVARKQLTDSDALYASLQAELTSMLKPVEQPLQIVAQNKPFVILVVGVNGAGKTTTIGKLAKKLQLEGKKVMLAAGDTFRAAAVEQLQVWGERNKIPVIAQHTGADSASVIFDAVQAAKARGIDVLIADTAGRLHTKDNLMEELKKVRRVIGKLDADAPHEVLLVLDAGTGQNAINQAKQFNQTVQLSGLALTKLDGTAKGGVIFALAKQFGLPIRYIGVGEGIDDLRTFEAEPFVQALFAERERS
ncbi:signal recognition particle-docking protein FtsY [Pseudomonas protegens]|uniref:Signal recognition particle receptor FtsY n=2 Tax=Pseudomonas protegens TaxID=380021 RepID=Q4K4B8_PSEF5|nr:signal recognition particle-docking protein FtsY [Pseudomonas protegens]AAY95047.1 signal recognition particle-docking protein FtsY [Pseudomonas protegens Pf-5]ASE20806.1 signal recognition particle-docking protein FtsY [Pseudomonas protegens]QEZ49628.1 signal recognition particle-docking protein FtsY [Pseudomonas protegens]QEZ58277.1 signal recognition particle-docking protein FtsY [Pseudomonas protegens]QEZ66804.1 signal recognition particle-docking protein FtsY [Pseudomonas protegens]